MGVFLKEQAAATHRADMQVVFQGTFGADEVIVLFDELLSKGEASQVSSLELDLKQSEGVLDGPELSAVALKVASLSRNVRLGVADVPGHALGRDLADICRGLGVQVDIRWSA